MPTYTFAHVDADPALTPDLVVVPGLTKPTGSPEAPLRTWVTRQHDDGARVLGVCSGAMVLAATGMLDGLDATSHWSRISALRSHRPAVHWLRGRRYVEDGSVTTTAAVTSGVPAALHLVAELAGPAEAQRVADLHPELGWTPDRADRIPKDHFAVRDWPVGLNYVEPWFRPTIGIALRDGVGELDATAAFEVYGQSAAARTVAIATGDTVRTRHGLVLLTHRSRHAPGLSRVVVPGARTWRHRPCAARVGRQPGAHAGTARGPSRSGRLSVGGRVQCSPAEPCRAHRRRHHVRDRQDDRLPDDRPQPRPAAPILAADLARHRRPRTRNPRRAGPRLPSPRSAAPPPGQGPHHRLRHGSGDRERHGLNLLAHFEAHQKESS